MQTDVFALRHISSSNALTRNLQTDFILNLSALRKLDITAQFKLIHQILLAIANQYSIDISKSGSEAVSENFSVVSH